MKKQVALVLAYLSGYSLLWSVPVVYAEYTSLISGDDFTAIKTDVTTVAVGIVSILVVVVGLVMLVRSLRG